MSTAELFETMTNSDIKDIIFGKQRELEAYLQEPKTTIHKVIATYCERDDFLWVNKHEKEIRSLIKRLEWELTCRRKTSRWWKQIDVDALRRNVLIVDVISSCINMSSYRPGRNMKCPFHEEKTASMHIYEQTNTWRCFGCQKWGSNIDFLMESYGISVKEAIELLAKY